MSEIDEQPDGDAAETEGCKETVYLSGGPSDDDSHRVASADSPGCKDTVYLSGAPDPEIEAEPAPAPQPNDGAAPHDPEAE